MDCVLLADAQWSTKLTVRERTVKDLNHQLKALCRRNRDGSFGIQDGRWHVGSPPGIQPLLSRADMTEIRIGCMRRHILKLFGPRATD